MFLFTVSTTLILVISAAGVIQALLLSCLLYFHPKSDRSVTSFLSLHIIMISLLMLSSVSQYFFSWHSILLFFPFHFLIGPTLYLYVLSFKEIISWRKVWPHSLLFLLIIITTISSYLSWTRTYPASGTIPEEILLNPYTYLRVLLRNVQMVVYFFLAKRVLNNYQRSINNLYSETSRISLTWVRGFLNGYLLIILLVSILGFLIFFLPEQFNLIILIVAAIITPYIYYVTFKGLTQPAIWQVQTDKKKEKVEEELTLAEEISSKEDKRFIKGLPDNRLTEITGHILLLMEKKKLFQEPELTLQILSDQLGIPAYQASQAINEGLKKSFYDLINGYRVEEAKRLLLDSKNESFTILSAGFEAGFNSKTTFNTVFKKFTGYTPTEYREKQRATSVSA